VGRIARRRLRMLREIEEAGRDHEVRELVCTIVHPIVEEVWGSEGGSHYISVAGQMAESPHPEVRRIWRGHRVSGIGEVLKRLQRALPELAPDVLDERVDMLLAQALHALAEHQRGGGTNRYGETVPLPLFVSRLIDILAAGMAAPVSEQTRDEQARAPGRHRARR